MEFTVSSQNSLHVRSGLELYSDRLEVKKFTKFDTSSNNTCIVAVHSVPRVAVVKRFDCSHSYHPSEPVLKIILPNEWDCAFSMKVVYTDHLDTKTLSFFVCVTGLSRCGLTE